MRIRSPFHATLLAAVLPLLATAMHPSELGEASSSWSITKTYDAPAAPVGPGVVVTVGANDLEKNIGGAAFSPCCASLAPKSVLLEHLTMTNVAHTVCQDTDGDLLCGEPGEPRVDECSLWTNLNGFRTDLKLFVIVWATSRTLCPYPLEALTIQGEITVTYA